MRGKPFEKGNKAGKGAGRPKGSSYVTICQEMANATEWERLGAWAAGKENGKRVPWVLRKYANQTILAYGFGKPRESIDLTNSDRSIAGVMRAFIAGGTSGMASGGVRPPGRILDEHTRHKPVAEADGHRGVDKTK